MNDHFDDQHLTKREQAEPDLQTNKSYPNQIKSNDGKDYPNRIKSRGLDLFGYLNSFG
jgi:hypothetical protein